MFRDQTRAMWIDGLGFRRLYDHLFSTVATASHFASTSLPPPPRILDTTLDTLQLPWMKNTMYVVVAVVHTTASH